MTMSLASSNRTSRRIRGRTSAGSFGRSRARGRTYSSRDVRIDSLRGPRPNGSDFSWRGRTAGSGSSDKGFQAVKRLVLFLTYAKGLESGVNPNWPSIGYVAPHRRASQAAREPSEFSIESLRPANETSLEADVCVVGTGAGGSVIAAKLAESGHRVIVLEAGPYRTADAFTQREAEAHDTMFQGHGVLTTRDS